VAGSGHGTTERALSRDPCLQELPQVSVFHVFQHGVQRLRLVTDSDQSHDVDILQTRHCPRLMVKFRPAQNISIACSGGFKGGGKVANPPIDWMHLKTNKYLA